MGEQNKKTKGESGAKKNVSNSHKMTTESTTKKMEQVHTNGKSEEVFEEVSVTTREKVETENEKGSQSKTKIKPFAGDDLESLRNNYAQQQGVKDVQVQAFSHTPLQRVRSETEFDNKAPPQTIPSEIIADTSEIRDSSMAASDHESRNYKQGKF